MAAIPKCPNCSALNNFESITIQVRGCPVDLVSIQCAACGSVVGIMDRYSVSDLINKLATKLNIHDL